MTIKEAKKFFGTEVMEPNLKNLIQHHLDPWENKKVSCRPGKTYLWCSRGPGQFFQGDWVWEVTHQEGWTKVVCTYRRAGVNFLKIQGHSKEHPFFDGSMVIEDLIPEEVNLKEDFGINPDLSFVFKTYQGRIKIR